MKLDMSRDTLLTTLLEEVHRECTVSVEDKPDGKSLTMISTRLGQLRSNGSIRVFVFAKTSKPEDDLQDLVNAWIAVGEPYIKIQETEVQRFLMAMAHD